MHIIYWLLVIMKIKDEKKIYQPLLKSKEYFEINNKRLSKYRFFFRCKI